VAALAGYHAVADDQRPSRRLDHRLTARHHAIMRDDLPTGTITFLFTDIEGSTRLLQALGAEYRSVLERHDALVRAALSAHDGVEVRTEGDSFFAVFRSAADAVAAAAEAQRALADEPWPQGKDVRIRMGLHTGEGRPGGDNYIGLDVHRAARLAAAGHGGQVLLSSTTRALIDWAAAANLSVRDLGLHHLKDLEQPEQVSQLVIPGLEHQFPPLRTLETPSTLPAELSSFVGRERELDEIVALVNKTRLVTLTGPGGTGKTRLALRIGARIASNFDDGVTFVDLAPVADPAMVAPAIARTVGLSEHADRTIVELLEAHLASRSMLLILDNFEQVLAAAESVARLLAVAPRVKVLVTSRTVLNLYGEQAFDVQPLALPDSPEVTDPAELSKYEAVALFIDRAQAASSTFALTAESARAVAEICLRLDGLPLAIELAASRVRVLEPSQILARLKQHLPLVTEGPRNVPSRQRTLRGTIDWSYRLLDRGEQTLAARLSIFEGGCTLEAAEAVCNPGGELGLDTVDGLASMVDHSLLSRLGAPGASRFRMLETIREYGYDALKASGELAAIASLHLSYYRDIAETAAAQRYFLGSDLPVWLNRFELEHDNIRAALRRSLETSESEDGLRLASAIWRFWLQRGYLREGRQWLEALLEVEPEKVSRARANGYSALGGFAYWQSDVGATERAYESALHMSRLLGDREAEAEALYDFAYVPVLRGDVEEARRRFEASLAMANEVNRADLMAQTQSSLGIMLAREGKLEDARTVLEQSLASSRAAGARFQMSWTLAQLAQVDWLLGRYRESREHSIESLRGNAEARNLPGIHANLASIAALESQRGHHAEAMRLLGASGSVTQKTGASAPVLFTQTDDDDIDARARKAIGDEAAEREFAEGAVMTLDDAVAYVEGLEV
jgi:predicted ATPase/class 3 adenylate cyclase